MLKQLLLLFNLFSFFVVTFLLPDGIKVNYNNLPSEFVRDSTYIIELTIEKGNIFGFAKFQQNVPPGFVAHPVETADASFTFADGKVKFIWMALPETNEVNISYALIASQDAPAEGVIEGKLSYIQDNERKSYDTPDLPIKVISDEPVIAVVPASATVARKVKALGGNEYEVELSITKQGITGFSKIEEYLPTGADASAIDKGQSMFSQVDEKAKFVWMAVPEDENVTVSYKVTAGEDIQNDLMAMEGNFSYLDENETKTVAIMSSGEVAEPPVVAELTEPETTEDPTDEVAQVETPVTEDPVTAETTPETTTDEPVKETPVVDEPATTTGDDLAEAGQEEDTQDEQVADATNAKTEKMTRTTDVPAPETGVSYKVQVVAGHKLVTEEFLRKTYIFQEPYLVENHEGWIKYTTGNFDVYRGARDKRESLVAANHNFPGPFVTAYNNGERITVQEALMISNQKWFK